MRTMTSGNLLHILSIGALSLCLPVTGGNWSKLLFGASDSSLFADSNREGLERDGDSRAQWRCYDQGFEAGKLDSRRGLSKDFRRHRRDYNSRWESDFRRGYEDGFDNRSDRDSRSRVRDMGEWRSHRNERDGVQDYGYSGPGSMTWSGRVDDYVELRIQGTRVWSNERQGAPTLRERYNFSSPLPRADVRVSVKKRDGRGRVSLIQQPNRSNGYVAVVLIDDDKGGADDYRVELKWQ